MAYSREARLQIREPARFQEQRVEMLDFLQAPRSRVEAASPVLARITGQLLARNGAVTLDTNTIRNNACTAAATTSTAARATTVAPRATTVPPRVTTVAPGVTTVAPGTTIPGELLPRTGAYTETLIFLAVVLVILGIVKIVVDRRRF